MTNIRNDTIRLHIIASSDNEKDQQIKMIVRDKLLTEASELFNGTITTENAVEILVPEIRQIKKLTDSILIENNVTYTSRVTLETEYFDTREYENGITMPAGKYLALKIILGNGGGKNWWCIMFPALCLPVAEKHAECVYSESEKKIITSDEKYEIRFRVIEYIEILKNKVDILYNGDNV